MAKAYGRSREDAARINRAVRRIEGLPLDLTMPRRGPRAAGGGGSTTVLTGVVATGSTKATTTHIGNDLDLGTLEVHELLTESQIYLHDNDETYEEGEPARLTAEEHSESTAYADGDLVLESGLVYENQSGSEIAAGTFASQSGDWTELGAPGVYFATEALTADTFDQQSWDAADGTLYVDRTRDTIELENHFATIANPVEGALVKYIGTQLIGFTCAAQEGWS